MMNNVSGIKEVLDIQRIIVQPGQKSEILKREGNEFLIVIGVQGGGILRKVGAPQNTGRFILCTINALRIIHADGTEFEIEVLKEHEEPLIAIIQRMLLTKRTQQ